MAVNITNITNIQNFYDMGLYASKASYGIFWGIILIAFFIIAVIRLKNHGTRGILAASFISFGLSLIFLNLHFVSIYFPVVFALILAATIAFNHFSPQPD